MILTDAGIDTLTESRDMLFGWLRSLAGVPQAGPPLAYQQPTTSRPWPVPAVSYHSSETASDDRSDTGELSPQEQKARVVALRGLSQAREGKLAAARETFGDAIRLDPMLDLRRLPSFWKQPKQTHDCVIDALYDAGRTRDAAALVADLRTKFRPRLLPSRPNR